MHLSHNSTFKAGSAAIINFVVVGGLLVIILVASTYVIRPPFFTSSQKENEDIAREVIPMSEATTTTTIQPVFSPELKAGFEAQGSTSTPIAPVAKASVTKSTPPPSLTEEPTSPAPKKNPLADIPLCSDTSGDRNKSLHPQVNNSPYRIVHTYYGPGESAITLPDTLAYRYHPYVEACKTMLVKVEADNSVTVLIPDLISTLVKQQIYGRLVGIAQPYFFYNDNLLFGGNAYEGSSMNLYSYNLRSQNFVKVISFDRAQPYRERVASPDQTKIAFGLRDNELNILDIRTNLVHKIVLADIDVAKGETLESDCGMGCNAKITWSDNKTIKYVIHQRVDSGIINTALRTGVVNIVLEKYPLVPVE